MADESISARFIRQVNAQLGIRLEGAYATERDGLIRAEFADGTPSEVVARVVEFSKTYDFTQRLTKDEPDARGSQFMDQPIDFEKQERIAQILNRVTVAGLNAKLRGES